MGRYEEEAWKVEKKASFVACSCGLVLTASGVNHFACFSHLWADGRITGLS